MFAMDSLFNFSTDVGSPSSSDPSEDLQLFDVHCEIRRLIQANNNIEISERSQEDASLSVLEEFGEILHKLTWYRPMFLQAIGVMWDAVDLVAQSAAEAMTGIMLDSALQLSAGSSPTMRAMAGLQQSQFQTFIPQQSPPIANMSPTESTARSRHRAAAVALTRYDLCLSDFANFVKSFKSFAGGSASRLISPASACRTRINQLREQIRQSQGRDRDREEG